jgi:hypothetical protein
MYLFFLWEKRKRIVVRSTSPNNGAHITFSVHFGKINLSISFNVTQIKNCIISNHFGCSSQRQPYEFPQINEMDLVLQIKWRVICQFSIGICTTLRNTCCTIFSLHCLFRNFASLRASLQKCCPSLSSHLP